MAGEAYAHLPEDQREIIDGIKKSLVGYRKQFEQFPEMLSFIDFLAVTMLKIFIREAELEVRLVACEETIEAILNRFDGAARIHREGRAHTT